ncbi:MAG: type II secretion system F family protein [Acidimicrobiia bacterium]
MNGLALVVGAAALFGALFLVAGSLLAPRQTKNRLAAARAKRPGSLADGVTGLRARATAAADEALDRNGRRASLETLLEQADVPMRASEAVVAAAAATAGAFLVGTLFRGLFTGLLLAALVVGGAWLSLRMRRNRRRAKFEEQLADLLQLLAGSLRSGYGLQQALEMAALETESPTSDELSRVMAETRMGRELGDALSATAERMDSVDFHWAVQAMEINRSVGGDLGEVLDAVAETIRTRAGLVRQVQALSAEGRVSAVVLLALPPGVAVLVTLSSPDYFDPFLADLRGFLLIGAMGFLMVAGALWLRRLIRPIY